MNIPDATVKSAASVLVKCMYGAGEPSEVESRIVRAMLESCVPALMAEAWEEGHDAGFTYGAFQGRVKETPNPYKETLTIVTWGTDIWGVIETEPSEEHARKVAARTGANLYTQSETGKWTMVTT